MALNLTFHANLLARDAHWNPGSLEPTDVNRETMCSNYSAEEVTSEVNRNRGDARDSRTPYLNAESV